MLRRKLTRIEVTLDDTRELEDLFVRPPQLAAQPQTALSTSNFMFILV